MYLNEQYEMYQIAYDLVATNNYEVLHIDSNYPEIWLEKFEQKKSKVIRLVHKGFDWKNHLKKDIAIVFQKTKAMRTLLAGKQVELYNVYVSSHTPVDDWEVFKKPMQLNEKNPIKMNIYYLSETDFTDEKIRFEKAIDIPEIKVSKNIAEETMEKQIDDYKSYLTITQQKKRKAAEEVLSFGKPLLTYVLLAINIFIFMLLELNGGSTETKTLIQYGAKYNPYIIDGQWWRLISSMFLHIGFIHLFMNMLAIFYLGVTVERIYGSARFILIYFFAGIGGSLASFAFTTNISAGASGAIFGLFGALLFFGLNYKKIFFQTMGSGILLLIGINIVFGFTVPQIDMGAHLGGLLSGFIASGIVHLPHKKKYLMQLLALVVYLALLFGLVTYGIHNNLQSDAYQLSEIEEHNQQQEYEKAIELSTESLKEPGEMESYILFQRSFAYSQLNEIDLAIQDLERSITINNNMSEAFYNLALFYYHNGDEKKAEEKIKKAYEMDPEDEAYIDLYEQIIGASPN